MDHTQVQEIATNHNLGKVYFQFNVAHPNNALIEVGYISVGNKRVLFVSAEVIPILISFTFATNIENWILNEDSFKSLQSRNRIYS